MTVWPETVDQIERDCAAIVALLGDGGAGRSIGHCPGWSTVDLVGHLGGVHRWAAEIVRTGERPSKVGPPPTSHEPLGPWLLAGAEELSAVLRRVSATDACWTFGCPPAVAGFWRRRQILETAVHRADVEIAAGRVPSLTVELAQMGIDEVVDFLGPRQVSLGRTPPLGQAVRLIGTGHGRSWTFGSGPTAATISGPESDLLLMLWKRPHAELDVEGDLAVLASFRSAALVP